MISPSDPGNIQPFNKFANNGHKTLFDSSSTEWTSGTPFQFIQVIVHIQDTNTTMELGWHCLRLYIRHITVSAAAFYCVYCQIITRKAVLWDGSLVQGKCS
jgi:hypothetical protein